MHLKLATFFLADNIITCLLMKCQSKLTWKLCSKNSPINAPAKSPSETILKTWKAVHNQLLPQMTKWRSALQSIRILCSIWVASRNLSTQQERNWKASCLKRETINNDFKQTAAPKGLKELSICFCIQSHQPSWDVFSYGQLEAYN